jgi:2-polyprenyl-3-methyl-5-hydroxy-6-metoxy-1,4-benzoquinol methylase
MIYLAFVVLRSSEVMAKSFREIIHEANIAVHRFEAKHYEVIHPEVYNRQEQERIKAILKVVHKLISDNRMKALDFGAGTGNLTGKLLQMGYNVTAVDISTEMCNVLKTKYKSFLETGKLLVLNLPMEDISFDRGEFDLITCYSVLHHLPDYVNTIKRLCFYLKKGGVMYFDHEISPFYWKDEQNIAARLVKSIYFHSNPFLNALYFKIIGLNFPSMDYALADYWYRKEHPLDHRKIERVFEEEMFEFFKRIDYYLKGTWFFNPVFCIYKNLCKPEMSLWIAKK